MSGMQDQKGFYDRSKLFWKGIEDLTVMAACAPPGGGRQIMSSRFTRHMHTLCMPPTSEVGPVHHAQLLLGCGGGEGGEGAYV